ncbi:MAG TPA: APC family permease [Vicinamibacteria bacterium]|nr:APC family permease [Vicinamibacteria bacterium]
MSATAPRELSRVLGRRDVVALAFGAMIGWGWVVLSGEMIRRAGTLGSALAFVVGAVMVLLVGLTYAELTSALSRAGGELAFTYLGIGPSASYVCGWSLVLAYMTVVAFEVVSLPTVLGYLFDGLRTGHLYRVADSDVYLVWVLVSIAGAIGIGLVNYYGLRFSSVFQGVAATLLFVVGLSFFVPGLARGDWTNLEPTFVSGTGFFRVVIMTPFLFLGFDVIPQVAEEINVPFREVGKLILLSIVMAMGWYTLVQLTVGLTLDETARAGSELVTADAMGAVYRSPWGARALIFGGMLGIVTSWNAFFIGASRLLFAMARGGMLPSIFARLHPRYESPVAVIVLLTAVSILAPFFGRQVLVWLVDAGGLATVIGYFFVTVSFLTLRSRFPRLHRPYRVRRAKLVGTLALVSTVFFAILYLPISPSALVWPQEWAIIIGWAILGLVFLSGARARVEAMGAERQVAAILGEDVKAELRPGPTSRS